MIPPPTQKQARVLWFAVTFLAVGIVLALLGLLLWGAGYILRTLSSVLLPLAIAGVLAYLLDPVVDALERKRVARPRAILLVFGMALLLLLGLAASVVPQAVLETRELVNKVPSYATNVQHRLEIWINHPPALVSRYLHSPGIAQPTGESTSATNQPAPGANKSDFGGTPATAASPASPAVTNSLTGATNTSVGHPTTSSTVGLGDLWQNAFKSDAFHSATAWLAQAIPSAGAWLAQRVMKLISALGLLVGLALVPVYAFYFLLEKRGIASRWTDYLPVSNSEFKDELVFVLRSINDYLITFFRGQVLVAMCDGILYTIGFLVIGLPYAVLIGVMATFLTMIPFLGAIVTSVTALVIAVVQFGDWLHPVLVLAVFGVVQSLEGLFISPKIMGNRVGLHPLTIIIAVMTGTTLFGGILGGILAIPLTATLRVLMFRYVWRRKQGARPADANDSPVTAA